MNTDDKPARQPISAEFPFASKFLDINGNRIHYIEEGQGDPILFIHGNPTSSYLWRNIIPHVKEMGRCIALDHIGMGKSDRPDIRYGFKSTYNYLLSFIEKLGLKNITLVLHDWGSIMGFHYANTHRGNVKAIAFMESSIQAPNFDTMPFAVKMGITLMRSSVFGPILAQRANIMLKKMLPDLIMRRLSEEELEMYNAPYPTVKSRRVVAAWPRDVPIKGKPEEIDGYVRDYHEWLKETEIPKLCFYVKPGIALQEEDVEIVKNEFKNTKVVFLGEGLHFIQEDYPHEIGNELALWYKDL